MSHPSPTPAGGAATLRRPFRATLPTGWLAIVLLTAGCAVPSATPEASSEPPADLARKAEIIAGGKSAVTSATGADVGGNGGNGPRSGGGSTGGRGAGTTGSATAKTQSAPGNTSTPTAGGAPVEGRAATWHAVTRTDDSRGDHGGGPVYADLTGLLVDEAGDQVRLTVNLGGVVPPRLADGEVQGVGIDVFHGGGAESDQQVFLDGGTHGWRAFLQTPRGFVRFPGSFSVNGRSLVVVVPWSSVGGREGARASVFVDWSDGAGHSGSDLAPDGQRLPLG